MLDIRKRFNDYIISYDKGDLIMKNVFMPSMDELYRMQDLNVNIYKYLFVSCMHTFTVSRCAVYFCKQKYSSFGNLSIAINLKFLQ